MASRPVSFTDVVLCATQGVDYDIRMREPGSALTVVVLQGGALAPHLAELAEAIAGSEYNMYAFVARESRPELCLSPLCVREARLDGMIARSGAVLSIAPCDDERPALRIGGCSASFQQALSEALKTAGYQAMPSALPAIDASTAYFFNRASDGGVQLEFSASLSESLHSGPASEERRQMLVRAIQTGIQQHIATTRSDLARTWDRFERATARIPMEIRTRSGRKERNGDRP